MAESSPGRGFDRARRAVSGLAIVALLLPLAPTHEAALGSDAWEDPSAGSLRDGFDDFWALFVLRLDDADCGAPLGRGDLATAVALRNRFLAEGARPERVAILLDDGDAQYGAATEAAVRAWLETATPAANAAAAPRLFVMLAGHGAPYATAPTAASPRATGSLLCLGSSDLTDRDLGAYLGGLADHVQVGVVASCSLCGGFADRYYGPVETLDRSGITKPGRVVAVGCSLVTECVGHRDLGSYFFQAFAQGLQSRKADGWTHVLGNDTGIPYDSERLDGLVTLEEAYWWALAESAKGFGQPPGVAASQRFQLRDMLDGGFVLSTGGVASVPNAGTGDCDADFRDYDEDGSPNALDVVNNLSESRAVVAPGGWVRTHVAPSPSARLLVTAPNGRHVSFDAGSTNTSLEALVGEPVDGTWIFEQRANGPANGVVEVGLSGKVLRNDERGTPTDLGVLVWNWHADSRTDESVLLDVDPCPASGLRVYARIPPAPGGGLA